jgi:hypothetical protein
MVRRAAALVSFALFAGTLLACPPADQRKAAPEAGSSACSRLGDNCEVSPGKLGTCVVKDGCVGGGSVCFVCQSQH